jgi:hypothetical protein
VFFAGLFVMVGGLVATGVIDQLARAATSAVEGKLRPATLLLLWASAALSAIVDNIPYVATMSPIVGELVNAEGGADKAQVLWWALAIGADLGGNATAVGASASVVVLGIAERAGHRISFWGFTALGGAAQVETRVHQRGHDHATDGGGYGYGGTAQLTEITGDELTFELQTGDEEEDCEQSVGSPLGERQIQMQGRVRGHRCSLFGVGSESCRPDFPAYQDQRYRRPRRRRRIWVAALRPDGGAGPVRASATRVQCRWNCWAADPLQT